MKIKKPILGKQVYIDPSAQILGRVMIGDHSSIWPLCVLRGDIQKIKVGRFSNIQDLSVVHVESNRACLIGNYVTVGHAVTLHACTVGNETLIGMGSIVLDNAVIGKNVILGAGSLVTQGDRLKPGSLYFGRPAKWIRHLTELEMRGLKEHAMRYVDYARNHAKGMYGRWKAETKK